MPRRLLGFLLVLLLLLPCAAIAEASANTPVAATIEEAVTRFLEAALQQQAAQTSGGWERYIYSQGLTDVTMKLEKFDVEKGKPLSVSFKVAGAQPNIKTQPTYDGDPVSWLKGVVDAMSIKDATVKTSLRITAVEGGFTAEYAPKAEAALQKSVKAIATKASKAFANKTILAAITDYLMPTPIVVPKKAPASLDKADYQPAFTDYVSRNGLDLDSSPIIPALLYGLKGYKLDVSGGPEAFALTYTAPDLADFLDTASTALGRNLCYDENAKNYTTDEQSSLLAVETEKGIIPYRHGKKAGEKESYAFNLLSLPGKLDPQDFYTFLDDSVDSTFDGALWYVQSRVLLMPDYPALPNPKTGLISGTSNGTKCIFKSYDDGYSRCVSVYDSNTDELLCTIFIESGKTATIKIPKGPHYFVIGVGDVWYGPDHLFSDLGGYSKTESIDIAGSRYYHTFTLNPKKDGNTEMYRLNYSDLFN